MLLGHRLPGLEPAFQIKLLLTCLGSLAYGLLTCSRFRDAVVCFALQALLFSQAAGAGILAVRHASLYALPPLILWSAFMQPRAPCCYVIASATHPDEYIGSTGAWRGRLYQHARHIHRTGLAGEQFAHTFIRRFRCEYAFVPVATAGGAYLEERLIRTFCPALNQHAVPSGAHARTARQRLRLRWARGVARTDGSALARLVGSVRILSAGTATCSCMMHCALWPRLAALACSSCPRASSLLIARKSFCAALVRAS